VSFTCFVFTRCDKVVPGLGTTNLLLLLLLLLPVSEFRSFHIFLTTLYLFFDNFLTTFVQLFNNFWTIFWQLFDKLWSTFWQLVNNCLTTFCYLFATFLTICQFFFYNFFYLFFLSFILHSILKIIKNFQITFLPNVSTMPIYIFSTSLSCRNWSPNYSVLVFTQ
jgi:hypothetical protein